MSPLETVDEAMHRNRATHDYVTGRPLSPGDIAYLSLPLEDRRKIVERDIKAKADAEQLKSILAVIIVGAFAVAALAPLVIALFRA